MSTAAADNKDISRNDGGGEEVDDASISSDTSDDNDEGEIYGQDMGSRFSFANGFVSLNQETLLKLQKDDPAVTKLFLFFDTDNEDDFAGEIDWEKEGYCIANNTHLKTLHILVDCYIWRQGYLQNFEALYEAIAKNRSIEHLSLSGSLLNSNVYSSSCLGQARTLQILRPFFKHNKNLRSFDLWELMTNLRGDAKVFTTRELVKSLSKCNDSSVRNLNICANGGVDENVVASGEWLNRHRNLEKLSLNLGSSKFGQGLCTALGNLLTNCDSQLAYLVLDGSNITDEGATILGNAFGTSKTLKKLYLIDEGFGFKMSQNGWRELSRGLLHSNSSLEAITLNGVLQTDRSEYVDNERVTVEVLAVGEMKPLGTALSSISSLKSLDLRDNSSLGPSHWGSFLRGLSTGNLSLQKLILDKNKIGDDGVAELGGMLLDNNSLKKLSLDGIQGDIKAESWNALFGSIANPQSSLEVLNLSRVSIDNDVLVALGNCLAKHRTLKQLDLEGVRSCNATGWQRFFGLLSNSNSVLEEVHLSIDSVGNEGVSSMVDCLASMTSLTKLHMKQFYYGEGDPLDDSSWETFSSLLGRPSSNLRALFIDVSLDESAKTALASALANNSSLETLVLGASFSDAKGLSVLENVLCNKTSIGSIYSSNHTFKGVIEKSQFRTRNIAPSKVVDKLLELNNNANKSEVARQKILRYHFFNGNGIDVQVFVDMELKLMPHAVAWICRCVAGLPLLYRLIRGMPSLCDYHGNAKLAVAKRKIEEC